MMKTAARRSNDLLKTALLVPALISLQLGDALAQSDPRQTDFKIAELMGCLLDERIIGGGGTRIFADGLALPQGQYYEASGGLIAPQLILAPGAQLVLRPASEQLKTSFRSSQNSLCANVVFLQTQSLIVDGDSSTEPVRILWDPDYQRDTYNFVSGTAPKGANGGSYGQPGQDGVAGNKGLTGEHGNNGPVLLLIASEVTMTGSLIIDLQGRNGGVGGPGERGGSGGMGATGRPELAGVFECKRAAGQPGPGGNGGRGGAGGDGGDGGAGGDVVIVTSNAGAFDSSSVEIKVAGGQGGLPGEPGMGGEGGAGGREPIVNDRECRFLSDVSPGTAGQKGDPGEGGAAGVSGPDGTIVFAENPDKILDLMLRDIAE